MDRFAIRHGLTGNWVCVYPGARDGWHWTNLESEREEHASMESARVRYAQLERVPVCPPFEIVKVREVLATYYVIKHKGLYCGRLGRLTSNRSKAKSFATREIANAALSTGRPQTYCLMDRIVKVTRYRKA